MLLLPFTALLASVATAASAPDAAQEHVLKLDFSVLRGSSLSSAAEGAEAVLVKRDGSAELILTNKQTFYSASLKIGSRGDKNEVAIDTGSSDLWVMATNVDCRVQSTSFKRSDEEFTFFPHRQLIDSEIPEADSSKDEERREDDTLSAAYLNKGLFSGSKDKDKPSCTVLGSFDSDLSETFKKNKTAPPFSITYGDLSYANGSWGTDYINFGPLNVSDCNLAVVKDTNSTMGVFGIGLPGLEVTNNHIKSPKPYMYDNFPLRLKASGAIKKVLYSLYLNSADASSGSVLFGAVDHAKYSGQLQTVPLINFYSDYYRNPIRFDIVLGSISLETGSQKAVVSTQHIPALLDSGTTITLLPKAMFRSLGTMLDGELTTNGLYEISCSYKSKSAFVVFNFSGVEIKVPLADLILTSTHTCYLGVMQAPIDRLTKKAYAILGDNFLRSAYVVYDLENYEVSLAQATYSKSEDIQVVSSSVPRAVKASGYSKTSVVSTVSYNSSSTIDSSRLKESGVSHMPYFATSVVLAIMAAFVFVIF